MIGTILKSILERKLKRAAAELAEGAPFVRILGLTGSAKGLCVAALRQISGKRLVYLCATEEEAERTAEDVKSFLWLLGSKTDGVFVFPSYDVDPYRCLSPHPEILERRALALWKLLKGRAEVVSLSASGLIYRIVSPEDFASRCRTIKVGDEISPYDLSAALLKAGYVEQDPVTEVGEYARRGGILDFFSPAHVQPIRVEFFGDAIESVRTYDPDSQRSISEINSAELVPMREMCPEPDELELWAMRAQERWPMDEDSKWLRERIAAASAGEPFRGYEFLLQLVSPLRHSVLDYLEGFVLVADEPEEIKGKIEHIWRNLHESYLSAAELGIPALPPEELVFEPGQMGRRLRNFTAMHLDELGLETDRDSVEIACKPVRRYHGIIRDIVADIRRACDQRQRIILMLSTVGRAERIADVLRQHQLPAVVFSTGDTNAAPEVKELAPGIYITVGNVSTGFYLPEEGILLLANNDLFDEIEVKPAAAGPSRGARAFFDTDLRDLREGDLVVHIEHGIGRFVGLKKLPVDGQEQEFVILSYRDDDKLYVPVDRLDLIQKYRGAADAEPPLDKLGGASWARTKARIKRSLRDMAEELLKLYAERSVVEGYAFSPDNNWMAEFEEAFEYEETPDQLAAIIDVKRDMETPKPMDRLICGDVGYGKTEVAMRAAFKAVLDGKQVAMLTPTTVLALQHYLTFKSRFEAFPVNIAMLSRFVPAKEQKRMLEDLEAGRVDIIIGTHRILSDDVVFHDLGLVIIDEEQRFGVAQKEKLKKLRTHVDVLSLSATPIPRTLHMALLGLRDMSVIETPPKDRLAIQTQVFRFDRNVIKSAIELELERQGQVYFVHNRIESIYQMASMIKELCPQARVAIAHGQMRELELERIMLKFINYEYDVLVATTIIENGLDIPRVNTIIIDRADTYGLAQLYQLRGRVGRSNRRAYAYLLVPLEETLSTVARKRLAAIREFSDLGSGFHIAALDLEIRGAGNLLGPEQHGHIQAVGFELYCQLLESAVRELKGEKPQEAIPTAINLKMDIRIPESYVPDPNQRMRIYRRISCARSQQELEEIRREISDRYGKYPQQIGNLLEYARIRLLAQPLRIGSIERSADRIHIRFLPEASIDINKLLDMVSRDRNVKLSPDGVLTLTLSDSNASPLPQLTRLLQQLA